MKSWQEIVKIVRRHRDESIRAITPAIPVVGDDLPLNVTNIANEVLPPSENEITSKTSEELVELLASSKFSSVEVVTAFLRRAGLAQQLANCVTEVLPVTALTRAAYLDTYLAQNGKPIGPLHGLPISVKEHIAMKGFTLNASFAGWYDRVADSDAHTLQLLWNAGAVFYVRTTQPQILMHLEAATNLYGVTVCPYNRELTSGGSSGGEGALLALRGSCLGIGTDIGGSVRSPAANCGIWSFRPSSYRIPEEGAVAPMLGEEQIVPVMGPMSTSFGGLHLFMKTLIDQKPWLTETSLIPMPWSFSMSQSPQTYLQGKPKLKVGVMWHDGVVHPHPPISRALKAVVDGLRKLPDRFDVVNWTPLDHDQAWDIISSLYFVDGGKEMKGAVEMSGEPWLPLSRFIIDEQPNVKEYNINEVWQLTVKRETYRNRYARHWNATGDSNIEPVDVILCPVGPGAAPPHECARYWGYTAVWNVLDYPAMVFPVTHVDQDLDGRSEYSQSYKPINDQDAWNRKLWTDRGVAGYKDAPVCLQLVARRWQDEKVFEAMSLIKDALSL